ncbi:DUF3152 domain-containing protein [Micromonospora parathelypteridis]|uniref:DUF3152 domain-containing protein n=1 Tax=Micromonospora parathelypteridis TaxID=1839617 RepID=A0A840W914_9ACTN|nr:DUF3152 domain-containing protein [Micromonospora parathelypteridis]MBB5479521.1 hypothetical protein [Micromonospora parathelypteridis]GGO30371.1 hypothetical protein GCM10011576_57820 [Micromonospora parathelypteridis]
MPINGRLLVPISLALVMASTACGTAAPVSGQAGVVVTMTPDAGSNASAAGSAPDDTPSPEVPTDAEIPTRAAGTFATATGRGRVIGTGKKRVRYRVSVERGIVWGDIPAWEPNEFAESIEQVLAAPNGWASSAQHPVTNAAVNLTRASWSFQRVDSSKIDVDVRLATPRTVDRLCGASGVDTQGVYSCKYGKTIMINLRRWLQGAPGYPVSMEDYHAGVINHEFGHFLGFAHMRCGGRGRPGPVMMTQTMGLHGCVPNVSPFARNGQFISGPWAPS